MMSEPPYELMALSVDDHMIFIFPFQMCYSDPLPKIEIAWFTDILITQLSTNVVRPPSHLLSLYCNSPGTWLFPARPRRRM
ncbi:hypothetical protein RSOLAG1IB_05342 [Rhizoctonia solani AG-1 IB]|uniref:Uncharacterized protein n=1 Tax=Thanatephorus cucumeris (strain AG1-IB / isolate 7/3/14) TaxID=1108050 RepID=A0A0B7G2F6_THACB|nr:hypothetical protein RSOLAG1IB_05342 [Rhizoctonia solani AG-1 IB]